MSDSEAHRVLERLVADPEFRARFELDPAGAARAAGFARFADDLAAADPAPMQALDVRESRSSLAGAFIAAAAEGFALVEFGGRLFGVDEAQAAVGSAPPPVNGQPWNADWYGLEGSGGPITPETEALLQNHNVSFAPAGIEDLKAGRMDPRVVAVLTEISREHRIVVTCTCSDHPMNTAGGSVSNHYYGRGLDIGSVDGKLVNAANPAARELALALAKLDPSVRPSEIGSPWALSGAAYFTDGDHQDHLHIGFDDPIEPGWKPPAEDPSLPVQQASPQPAEVDDDTAGDDRRADGTVDTSGDDDAEDDSDDQDSDDQDEDDTAGDDLRADGTVDTSGDDDEEDDSDEQDSAEAAPGSAAPLSPDPDDWEGNLDDEDGGADEVDGSNEDEADEAGGEDDDGVAAGAQPDVVAGSEDADDSEGDDEGDDEDEDGEDEDEDEDEPGEGSNGEDAMDDNAESDSSGNSDSSDSQDGATTDSSSNGSDAPGWDAGDGVAQDAYPGDDAPREAIAAWMAAEAEQRGLPPELPVMASLVESGLRNLNYGDADSVGFFQMRTSIWDGGAYAGYQDRAELQLKWFLDHAEAVKNDRLAASAPVDDPNSFGEWIADVERPAEQYRGRYQLRLDEARSLLDAANPETDTPSPSPGNEAQVLKAVDPDAADSASR